MKHNVDVIVAPSTTAARPTKKQATSSFPMSRSAWPIPLMTNSWPVLSCRRKRYRRILPRVATGHEATTIARRIRAATHPRGSTLASECVGVTAAMHLVAVSFVSSATCAARPGPTTSGRRVLKNSGSWKPPDLSGLVWIRGSKTLPAPLGPSSVAAGATRRIRPTRPCPYSPSRTWSR
jgi:hypothetical protein